MYSNTLRPLPLHDTYQALCPGTLPLSMPEQSRLMLPVYLGTLADNTKLLRTCSADSVLAGIESKCVLASRCLFSLGSPQGPWWHARMSGDCSLSQARSHRPKL